MQGEGIGFCPPCHQAKSEPFVLEASGVGEKNWVEKRFGASKT